MGNVRSVIIDPFEADERVKVRGGALVTRLALGDTSARDYLVQSFPNTAVRMGLISGLSGFRKQGANNDIDQGSLPETVWFEGGLYPFQTTQFQAEVFSSDAADTVAGTGARVVRVIGLAGSDWAQVSENITMNGVTPVTTTRTDWWRIDRMVVREAGSNLSNAGKVTCQVAGGGDVLAACEEGTSTTQLCVLTLPGDRKGAIMGIDISILSSGSGTEVEFGLFTTEVATDGTRMAERLRTSKALRGAGTTAYTEDFKLPIAVEPRTDIEMRVLNVDSNNVSVSGVFSVLAMDESEMP